MKIFITGSTGFIGKHVVEKLREDKNNELFLLSKNLADIESWRKEVENFKPDTAIHLAWEGLPDYGAKVSIKNLNYGLNLMDLLAEAGCKNVLMVGSCWELLPHPPNSMTVAKTLLRLYCQEIAKGNNMNFIWARIFFIYGSGQRETSLIPSLLKSKEKGAKPEIKMPEARNDFIYVGDAAKAIALLVKKCQKSGVYDIGSGKLTSVQDIAKIIFPDFKRKPVKNFIDGPVAEIKNIKKEIGWQPETNIKKGIKLCQH